MRANTILFLWLLAGVAQAQTAKVEYVPGSTVKIVQLVGDFDRERNVPTQNLTDTRYHLWGTDLGVPFRHNGRTYLLFGDTIGQAGGDAIAYTTDTQPEDGLDLTFIHDSSGTYRPVQIPGISQADFEVPMEGVSVGGRMYIYHTTTYNNTVSMGSSVVAVSEDDGWSFRFLYEFSSLYFINLSAVKVDLSRWSGFPQSSGSGLVFFGSGKYRQSDVRLAFQPADSIEHKRSLRYFAGFDVAGRPRWVAREVEAVPLFSQPCVGEISVTYNPFLRKWLMLYNCGDPRGINFRTADDPWGPWSAPQVLFDPWKDNGYCHFMHVDWQFRHCDNVHDPGRENEWGGEYGPYQFEDLATGTDSTTTIYFTLSTWNPYTVVLMKSTLKLINPPTSVHAADRSVPRRFRLWPAFPNPFSSRTRIEYQLPQSSYVEIAIYNVQGRRVATLLREVQDAGRHHVFWRGTDDNGRAVGSGIYFYRILRNGESSRIRRMVMLK